MRYIEGDKDAWERVAQRINEAMRVRDQISVEREADVSVATIRKLQYASQTRYRSAVLARLSEALGWQPDAIARMVTDPTYEPLPVTTDEAQTASYVDPADLSQEQLELLAELPDNEFADALETLLRRRRERRAAG